MPRRPVPVQSTPSRPRRPSRPDAPPLGAPRAPAVSVRSLDRALDLMEALERLRAPAGVRALEAITRIPKATAQRLLDVLEKRGYVQKERGRYALAVGTVRLARGFLAGDNLAAVALPVLQQLTAVSGETCGLYVRQGLDRILVQRVESPHPLRHHTPIGERLPLHIGASGHVLCTGMPEELLHHYLAELGPIRLASGQSLSKKEFLARIQQTRLRGYAIRFDERFAGVCSVAAPVMHKDKGVVAAINIAGPSSRLSADKLEQLSLELINAAGRISESLDRL